MDSTEREQFSGLVIVLSRDKGAILVLSFAFYCFQHGKQINRPY